MYDPPRRRKEQLYEIGTNDKLYEIGCSQMDNAFAYPDFVNDAEKFGYWIEHHLSIGEDTRLSQRPEFDWWLY